MNSVYHFYETHIYFSSYTVSQKVPIFKLSVTTSNLNRVSKFCTGRQRIKFATKSFDITHLTLGMLLHYLEKLKIPIFWQT